MSEKQAERSQKPAECLKIPVVVGVTGHKDIKEDESYIMEHLNMFWQEVRKIVGEDTPIVLLSSIAEGADHYVVESLRRYVKETSRTDIKYCVVLPFAQEEYEKDFETPEAMMKFSALRAQDTSNELLFDPSEAMKKFKEDLAGAYKVIKCKANPDDYAVASDYVRSHSDILITLWDGFPTLYDNGIPKRGGTYHQIRTAFNMDVVHLQEKQHLIVNLTVNRRSEHTVIEKGKKDFQCKFPNDSALNVVKWDSKTKKYNNQSLASWVNEFNDDKSPQIGRWERIKNCFLGKQVDFEDGECFDIEAALRSIRKHNEQKLPLPDKPYNYLYEYGFKDFSDDYSIIKDDFARYEYFDKLATTHQIPHKNHFYWIAIVSFFVGLLGQAWGDIQFAKDDGEELHGLIMELSIDNAQTMQNLVKHYTKDEAKERHEQRMHLCIFFYLLGCLGLFVWGKRISRQNHYGQYVQPRVIAELMRLKMIWTLSGIQESFVDNILKDCANYWFALPVCNWDVWDDELKQDASQRISEGKSLPAIQACWLNDQKKYYSSYLLSDSKHWFLTKEFRTRYPKWLITIFKKWLPYFKKHNYRIALWKKMFKYGCRVLAPLLVLVYFLKWLQIYTRNEKRKGSNIEYEGFSEDYQEWLENYGCRLIMAPLLVLDDFTLWLQKKYVRNYDRLDAYFSFMKKSCIILSFVMAFLLVLVYASARIWNFDHSDFLFLAFWGEFVVGIFPFVISFLGWLLEKNHWDSLATKYRKMQGFFEKAIQIVGDDKNHSLQIRQHAIKDLMLLCHQENAEWKSIKNESKPEPMII